MAHVQKTCFYHGNHGIMYIWVHALCWETEISIKNEIFNKLHYWKHYVSVWQLRFSLSRVNCQYFEMNFSYSTPNTLSRWTISPGSRKCMGIITFGDSHLFSLWPYKSLSHIQHVKLLRMCGLRHMSFRWCLSQWFNVQECVNHWRNISVFQTATDIGNLFVVWQLTIMVITVIISTLLQMSEYLETRHCTE